MDDGCVYLTVIPFHGLRCRQTTFLLTSRDAYGTPASDEHKSSKNSEPYMILKNHRCYNRSKCRLVPIASEFHTK